MIMRFTLGLLVAVSPVTACLHATADHSPRSQAYKVYSNAAYGYSFSYPATWQEQEDHGASAFGPVGPRIGLAPVVITVTNPAPSSTAGVYASVIRRAPAVTTLLQDAHAMLLVGAAPVGTAVAGRRRIGGMLYHTESVTVRLGPALQKEVAYATVRHGTAYIFISTVGQGISTTASDTAAIATIINSIKVR